ncbi:MAG: CDP-diacylglycerol--glycerol-3-phosphate 3-phosphatidyltransferase, partial [Mycoplasmataceae bacterium]|nr:CDP-diacylglycerol--glycerol-3-phosphate 3-phosphatidyltransferase [Mycoplasmataceae bacterium]
MKLNIPNILVLVRLSLVPIIVISLLLPSMINVITFNIFKLNGNDYGLYITDIIAGILFLVASIT